jgi:hypothetical protein
MLTFAGAQDNAVLEPNVRPAFAFPFVPNYAKSNHHELTSGLSSTVTLAHAK